MSNVTFYLRGVELLDLVQKYIQGQFIQVSEPILKSSPTVNTQVVSVTSKTSSRTHNYEFTNESGRPFICIGYQIQSGGKYGEISPGQPARCMYCLREVNSTVCIGIPISKETGNYLRLAYCSAVDTIYHTIDIFCWFRCALAELEKRLHYRRPIYSYSMTYLSEMYEATTKLAFSTLVPSPDNRLLKVFNGPMDYSEWDSNEILKYSSKPENICYLPVVQYIEGNDI